MSRCRILRAKYCHQDGNYGIEANESSPSLLYVLNANIALLSSSRRGESEFTRVQETNTEAKATNKTMLMVLDRIMLLNHACESMKRALICEI